MSVKYPFVTCKLVGEDGNAFAIMGRMKHALSRTRIIDPKHVDEALNELTKGDYNQLLCKAQEILVCDPDEADSEFAEDLLKEMKDHLQAEGRKYFDPELDKELVHG